MVAILPAKSTKTRVIHENPKKKITRSNPGRKLRNQKELRR
jgi:hypothetical protein